MKHLQKLLVVSAAIAASTAAFADPVNAVSYGSLTGTQVVDFDDLPSASAVGTNYDTTFVSHGVGFGERFAGQALSTSGDFDVLANSTGGTLAVVAGAANQNLDLLGYNGTNVLTGLGPRGYPEAEAVGEGSFAALFSTDQSQFGFQLVGGDGGNAYVSFFRRDGSLISTVTVPDLANAYYGFERDGGTQDIAGISIYNDDPGGIGFDNLKHDVVSTIPTSVPEPQNVALMLAGLGLLRVLKRRPHRAAPAAA